MATEPEPTVSSNGTNTKRGTMNTHVSSIRENDDKGFTLVEILIAIVLVGILSAVAVVGISNLVSKGIDIGVQRIARRGEGRVAGVLRREGARIPTRSPRSQTGPT